MTYIRLEAQLFVDTSSNLVKYCWKSRGALREHVFLKRHVDTPVACFDVMLFLLICSWSHHPELLDLWLFGKDNFLYEHDMVNKSFWQFGVEEHDSVVCCSGCSFGMATWFMHLTESLQYTVGVSWVELVFKCIERRKQNAWWKVYFILCWIRFSHFLLASW